MKRKTKSRAKTKSALIITVATILAIIAIAAIVITVHLHANTNTANDAHWWHQIGHPLTNKSTIHAANRTVDAYYHQNDSNVFP